jgi:hypothetical protein
MNEFRLSARDSRWAALLAALGFAGIAAFEVALAAGVPWGHAAWGGAHSKLSTAERTGSAVAILVWMAAAAIVLGRAGVWGIGGRRRATLFRWGTWFLAAVSALAALMNFASQSRWENLIFGPLALLLALLCTVVARSATAGARADAGKSAGVGAR